MKKMYVGPLRLYILGMKIFYYSTLETHKSLPTFSMILLWTATSRPAKYSIFSFQRFGLI